MASIRYFYDGGSFGSKLEMGFHFGTSLEKTENLRFSRPKKNQSGSKRVLDKSFNLK